MSMNVRLARSGWATAALVAAAFVAGCGSDKAAPQSGGTTATASQPSATLSSATTVAGQPSVDPPSGQSADMLSCDLFTKETLAASVAAHLPDATILEVKTTGQGAGRLDCNASFPPAVEGAMGIEFTIQDGYYANGGYVSSNSRPSVIVDFTEERDRRAAKTYGPDDPYVDTLHDAPEFGADAYYLDTVYGDTGEGGVKTKLIVVRQTLPFVIEASINRGPTTAAGDLFTQPDARHALIAAVMNTLLAAIES